MNDPDTNMARQVLTDPVHILASFATWKRAHENLKPGDSPIMTRDAPFPEGRDPGYLD